MLIKDVKNKARQWVSEEAVGIPGFRGALFHGSINCLPDDALMPATSDVDVLIVLDSTDLPNKLGILRYKRVTLEVSYLSTAEIQSPEQILGVSHLAGSFRGSSVIMDPSGRLAKLQEVVSRDYAKREWVYRRCEHARRKVLGHMDGLSDSEPFHDQVTHWLFGTGVTTHILLVAGLKNPTVKRRYLAVRQLLAEYGRLNFYDTLLEMLGCEHMSKSRAEHHLTVLAEAFDAAKTVIKTPFVFASDISHVARPLAIVSSRDLIERGYHREAVFWIVATYSRCQKVLYHDAPAEIRDSFTPGYGDLLADLGITSFNDLQQRSDQVKSALPDIWSVAEGIMKVNPEIED
jgi:hypothetical protein